MFRIGLVTFGLTVLFCAPARAQQAPTTIRLLPEDLQRGLNGHQHNFYFLPPGVEGENYVDAGFFGQRLRPYLGSNTEALNNLNRYKHNKTLFLLDRIVAVAAFGLYGQQIYGNGEVEYFNNTQKVALGIFAASVLATLPINRDTNHYLQQTVRAYNAGDDQGAFWPRVRPSAVGLGRAATGQAVVAVQWVLR